MCCRLPPPVLFRGLPNGGRQAALFSAGVGGVWREWEGVRFDLVTDEVHLACNGEDPGAKKKSGTYFVPRCLPSERQTEAVRAEKGAPSGGRVYCR